MKTFLFYTISISFFSASYCQQTDGPVNIDSIVIRHMQENHVPGLALAIIKNGKTDNIRYYGFSNLETSTKVDSNTIFEIASMTKQVTCAAILLLQEDGKLSIKDKLSKHLPGLTPLWNDITIEQLMNHTSGLRDDWDEPTVYFFLNNTVEKLSSAQQRYPLLFKPGTGFKYSSGPFFLGLVIEAITGKHYSCFLKERIFTRLGMFNTNVYDSTSLPVDLAKGYRWANEMFVPGVEIPAVAESRADVGLTTSLPDMIKWSLALSNNRLLNQESINFMFSPGRLRTGQFIPYSSGWYISFFRDQLIYEHGGAFRTGYNSRISKFPASGTEIIILSNKWQAKLSDLAYELANLYDPGFKKISGSDYQHVKSNARDNGIKKLFLDLSVKKYDDSKLYKKLNISGFDPDELKDLLKGFRGIECIGIKKHRGSFDLFNTRMTEVLYYKVFADDISFWSIAYDSNGKLICINLED